MTGEGNKLLASGVYKAINKKLNVHKNVDLPYKDKIINKQQLEIEHIKSISANFKLEDPSYTGCLSIFKKCTFLEKPFSDLEYATSLASFSLGSIIKFNQKVKTPYLKNFLERFLIEAIKITPEYPISYWVLSELHLISGQKEL